MSSLKADSLAPSVPSPTPSNTSTNGAKRKRAEESRAVVYSQPSDTNSRNHIMTNLTYAIEHLQQKPDTWFTFKEIILYLSLKPDEVDLAKRLKEYFQQSSPSSKIEYDPATKKYRYRPKYNIRNNAELRQFLQNQKTAQGLSVKDLKDGWPTVQDDLRILEQRKQILVRHNTKDTNARTV